MPPETKIVCPECQRQGLASRVFPNGATSTLMGGGRFIDAEGRAHYHDPNTHTRDYYCSHRHRWSVESLRTCWCGHTGA
jgi:hypothetical protein